MGLRTVIQGGVERLVSRGYVLELGYQSETFASADEFSGFLKSRTGVSADAMSRLRELPLERLRKELAQTEAVYKLMLEALLQVVERNAPVAVLWRELDISVLPDEQNWPAILFAVSASETLPAGMKRESVERFLEYLRARKSLLRQILSSRNGTRKGREHSVTAEVALDDERKGEPAMAKWPVADQDPEEVTVAARTRSRDYRRIKRDVAYAIHMSDGERLPLYLSRWKIVLSYSSGTLMLEEEGNHVSLPRGEHHAGRSSSCSAALGSAPQDVSRKHLRIENRGDGVIVIEDMSTKGTWMPEEFLERRPD